MSKPIDMDTIKRCVKTLLESQETIARINKTLKDKRKVLNDSKSTTQKFLEDNELAVLDVGSHELMLKERVTAATLNKDFMSLAAKTFFEGKGMEEDANELAMELTEFVWKMRADRASKKMFLSVKKAKKKKLPKRKVKEMSVDEDEKNNKKAKAEEEEPVSVESL